MDTRRKLNVHKTFSRRPGCLLNILCTFNLCPVSRGLVVVEISHLNLHTFVIIVFISFICMLRISFQKILGTSITGRSFNIEKDSEAATRGVL